MTPTRTTRRGKRIAPRNFYLSALDAAEQERLDLAASVEGLDDEVALLRVLVRRELEANPDDVALVLRGITLLVRAVAARYRLSPADQQALEGRIVEAVRALTETVQVEAEDG